LPLPSKVINTTTAIGSSKVTLLFLSSAMMHRDVRI
jgi:hypothetical protein